MFGRFWIFFGIVALLVFLPSVLSQTQLAAQGGGYAVNISDNAGGGGNISTDTAYGTVLSGPQRHIP